MVNLKEGFMILVSLAIVAIIAWLIVKALKDPEQKKSQSNGVVVNPGNSSSSFASPYNNDVVSGRDYAAQYWQGHVDPKVGNRGAGLQTSGVYGYPYSKTAGNSKYALFDARYPMLESQPSRYGTSCGNQGNFTLSISSLMPSSWRTGNGTSGAAVTGNMDDQIWAKYAPTKAAFDRSNATAGSLRLPLNTRSPHAKQMGVSTMLFRQGPAIPIASKDIVFNDSSFRQDLVYNATGYYPASLSASMQC